MAWREWHKRLLQQKDRDENLLAVEAPVQSQQNDWNEKLAEVKASLDTQIASKDSEGLLTNGNRWQESQFPYSHGNQNRCSRTELAGIHRQGTGLRVSFPLSLGMGLGLDGCLITRSPALRIVHLKFGSDISYQAKDSILGEDTIRYTRWTLPLPSD